MKLAEDNPDIFYQSGVADITRQKAREVKSALQKIADGAEEATVKDLRDDLEQYGGTNDVTFIYGDEKKGLFHIADKHGGIKTLLKVLDTVVDGNVKIYVPTKKTIILTKGNYEAILSLNEHGKKKTWLLTGYDTTISPDAERQVSANLKATQSKPTFGRQELGAELDNFNITPSEANVKQNQQKFYQGENNPLGSYMPASRVIHLFKKANRSTLIHELGHHFTMQYVKALEANGRTDKLEGFYNWLGINNISEATTQTWEQMARGFETISLFSPFELNIEASFF